MPDRAFGMSRFDGCSRGKGGQNQFTIYYTMYMWGDDVPEELDGVPFILEVFLIKNWTLADLKTAVKNAMAAKALEHGLTMVAADAYIQTFETGT